VNNSAATQESQESQGSIDSPGNAVVGSTGLVLQDTYTLGPCIGQGGMGEVYEATHVRLPGRMAVKILRQHLLTNQDAFARFCREAEIMSSLRHPHIIQIFDFNTSLDGLPYFVMEYLDGVDLETRLADSGPLPLAAVVRIVDAVASALGAAHALGVVHRDLKPANIFLMPTQCPVHAPSDSCRGTVSTIAEWPAALRREAPSNPARARESRRWYRRPWRLEMPGGR
jgi:serine/threonine protein kinase